MSEFAPVLNVSTLDGSNGFRLDGDSDGDQSGRTVAGGGDFNGDGIADLLIGAPQSDTSDTQGTDRGLAYLVFGASSWSASQTTSGLRLAGTAYRFLGETDNNQFGRSLSNAGDVNGDGIDDLLVGAPYVEPSAAAGQRGASYLIFGGSANFEMLDNADGTNDNKIVISSLAPANGYRFAGVSALDFSGTSVSGGGDVNGDGFADLIIGAPNADPVSGASDGDEGAAYIVFGGLANVVDLDDDDGEADGRSTLAQLTDGEGVRLDGSTYFTRSRAGNVVALAGDVNGDGFADVLVGAPGGDPSGTNQSEGAAYLVFGRPGGFAADSLDLSSPDGISVTRFDGEVQDSSGYAGGAVSGLGDVNGDGFADIVIGAHLVDIGSNSHAGAAYVVFGQNGFGSSQDLADLDGTNGFRLEGLRDRDIAGSAVSGAGDVNGDGFDDILVSAHGFDRIGANYAGAAYVVFGKASGFAASIKLGNLNGNTGFLIEGAAAGDQFGRSVSAAGDINGDGFDDILVGASGTDNNGSADSGSAYVIYGHRAETAVTRVGTEGDNIMNAGKGDDTISGLSGDDRLIAWEGDDFITGGDGADSIDGGDGDDAISGGSGIDALEGGAGNDSISGGSDRDVIIASAGEDDIDGGSERDLWDFSGFGAKAITVNLATGLFAHPNLEDVQTFTSIEDVIGTDGADTITGGGARNTLNGGEGADTLSGGGGADLITGGAGADWMASGNGPDRFIYSAITDSGTKAAARDRIADFTVDPAAANRFIDRIDVSDLDAKAGTAGNNAFIYIGGLAFSAEGQIRATASGADTLIEFNTSGAGRAEMTVLLQNFSASNLSAFDFAL